MLIRTIEDLVSMARTKGSSDVHLVCGLAPKCRIDGQMEDLDSTPLSHEDLERYAQALAGEQYDEIRTIGELDLARDIGGTRVRVNLYRVQGHVSVALRLLSNVIPPLMALNLPPAVNDLPKLQRGIVLVTGETGSGKSTTLAALLDEINHTRRQHIITLEDPVEYMYKPDLCVINQREIGSDTRSYADGLRAILREDPDIILIGEMRDLDTIEIALTAAETGHLVFATLHTNSAADSVDRIVQVFPGEKQPQVRMQLSSTLQAVLAQQLLPKKNERGRIAACELMMVTPAIRNLIREGKTPQIDNAIQTSAQNGSITMDNALIQLYRNKYITAETAKNASHNYEYVKRAIGF